MSRIGLTVEVLAWTRRLPAGALETISIPPAVVHRVGLFSQWDMSLQHTMNILEWLHGRAAYHRIWGHYLYPAGFAAVLFAETVGLPSVVSARGNDVDRLMFPPGDFARLQWTLQRATSVTAVSADLARKIGVLLGSGREVTVLPNTVGLDTFRPPTPATAPDVQAIRARLGIADDEAVLGFSGELRHKKGVGFILGALHEVRAVRPACLLVIGESRQEEGSALAAFAADYPEDARRIITTGHLEEPAEVAAHLRACDVVLQPSLWEGMPNALLEAMACARIVIASDAGGIPEVIEHGKNGFVLPKHNLHRLGEAIVEVLALPPDARAELEQSARQRVAEHFNSATEDAILTRLLCQ